MASKSITTSIPMDLWNLAREKNLKWNECLIAGIKQLANAHIPMGKGETIEEESQISKLIRAKQSMQGRIDDLNDELDKEKQKLD